MSGRRSLIPLLDAEFLTMPFKLTNPPRCIPGIRQWCPSWHVEPVIIYLDDIFIFSNLKEELLSNLASVLIPTVCEGKDVNCITLQCLGFIISSGRMTMDPEEDQKQLQRFLSFANFYFSLEHFIDGFINAHLHLCSKFSWSPEAETAFHMTLSRFASLSVLQTPDPKLQSIVEVDTSEVGSECSSEDNKVHPYAYFPSSVFTSTVYIAYSCLFLNVHYMLLHPVA